MTVIGVTDFEIEVKMPLLDSGKSLLGFLRKARAGLVCETMRQGAAHAASGEAGVLLEGDE